MSTFDTDEVKKLIAHVISEVVEYKSSSVVSKVIIKKPTGTIMVMSFDSGTEYTEQVSPFDTFFLIIEGRAEIELEGKLNLLQSGEGIIIPAQHRKSITAKERFKMIVAVIKSGYE